MGKVCLVLKWTFWSRDGIIRNLRGTDGSMSGEASKGLVRSCDGQGIEAELGLE